MLNKLGEIAVPLGFMICVAGVLLWPAIQLMRVPRAVAAKHRLLRKAVSAANAGTASGEQFALLKDAERAGLATCELAGIKRDPETKKAFWFVRWRHTDECIRQLYAGQYFSAADIEEELAAYEIKI